MDVDIYVDAHVIMVFDFDLCLLLPRYSMLIPQSSQSRFNSPMFSLYVSSTFLSRYKTEGYTIVITSM